MTALNLPFDFRFAWGGAKLAFPFVRRGITPEGKNKKIYTAPVPITKKRHVYTILQQHQAFSCRVFWDTLKQTLFSSLGQLSRPTLHSSEICISRYSPHVKKSCPLLLILLRS